MQFTRFRALLFASLCGLLIWGCSDGGEDQRIWNVDPENWNYNNYGIITDNEAALSPSPQEQQERTFEPPASQRIKTIGWYPESEIEGDREAMLLSVASIHVNADESELYIFDSEDLSVRTFSLDEGKLLTRYGGTAGEGPGEIKFASGYAVTSGGSVLISDSRLRRVSVFDEQGEHRTDISFSFQVANVIAVSDTNYVLAIGPDYNHAEHYGVFDFDGKLQETFGKLSDDVRLKGGLAGVLVHADSRTFVQAIGNTGYVMAFSGSFEPLFYRESLDGTKALPKWLPTERGYQIDQASLGPTFYKTLNVWDQEFFVRRYDSKAEKASQMLIDAYDLSTGDYKYSIRRPQEDCSILFVTINHLYTNCFDEGIGIWERPSLQTDG